MSGNNPNVPARPQPTPVVLFNKDGLCTLMDRDYPLGKNSYVPFDQVKAQLTNQYGVSFAARASTDS